MSKRSRQVKMTEPPMQGGWERPTSGKFSGEYKAAPVSTNRMIGDKNVGDKGAISKNYNTPCCGDED